MRGIIQKPMLGDECMSDGTNPADRNNVLKLLFNEGSGGQVFDLSGNGNTGTFIADTYWVSGKFGSALSFDGTGDYVECGTSDTTGIYGKSGFTVRAVVSLADKTIDRTIVSRCLATTSPIWILWYDVGDDKWEFLTGGKYAKSDGSPSLNQWYDIVGRWDGNEISIWVDGVKQSTTDTGVTPGDDSGRNTQIGNWLDKTRNFQGLIDHAMIYSQALLSASEIALLCRGPFCDLGPRRLVYAPVAGGTLPVYMHHYRQAS